MYNIKLFEKLNYRLGVFVKKILFLLFVSFNFFSMQKEGIEKKYKKLEYLNFFFKNFLSEGKKNLILVENEVNLKDYDKNHEGLFILKTSGLSFGHDIWQEVLISENMLRIVQNIKKESKKIVLLGAGYGGLTEFVLNKYFGSEKILYNDQNKLALEKYCDRIDNPSGFLIKNIFDIKKEDFKEENYFLNFSNCLHFYSEASLREIYKNMKKHISKDEENFSEESFLEKFSLKNFIKDLSINFKLRRGCSFTISSNRIFTLIKKKESNYFENLYNLYEIFINNKNIENKFDDNYLDSLSKELNKKAEEYSSYLCFLNPCMLFDKKNIQDLIINYKQLIIFLPNNTEHFFKKIINFDENKLELEEYRESLLSNLIENPAIFLIKELIKKNIKIEEFLNEPSYNKQLNRVKDEKKIFGIIYLFQTR